MKTLSEIRDALSEIQSSMSIEGPAVEIQRELLARSIYENEVNLVAATLNSSILRATNLNSTLTHAADLGYSTFRGKNQRLLVSNLLATQTRTVNKFDLAGEVSGKKLVYAKSYEFYSGQAPSETLELIVCDGVNSSTTTISRTNIISVDFLGPNISNDISVTTTANGVDSVSEVTENIKAIGTGSNVVAALTIADYGVKVVNFDIFPYASTVTLKWLDYSMDTIDPSSVVMLNGFSPIDVDISLSVESVAPEERVETKQLVANYAIRYWLSDNVVRSSVDLNKIIYNMLTEAPYFVKDCVVVHKVSDEGVYSIDIYYTRASELGTLVDQFLEELSMAAYIPSSVSLIRASAGLEIRPTTQNSDDNYFTLVVYYKDTAPVSGVTGLLEDYSYLISDRGINLYKLLSDVKALDNVVYCELVSGLKTDTDAGITQMTFDFTSYLQVADFTSWDVEYRIVK